MTSIFCCIVLIVPCLLGCVRNMIQKMMNQAMMIEKEKGGDVEQGLSGFNLDDLALCRSLRK